MMYSSNDHFQNEIIWHYVKYQMRGMSPSHIQLGQNILVLAI